MPELPEVETIRLGLSSKIAGRIIKDVKVLEPKSIQGDLKLVTARKILNITRRAKLLIIELSGQIFLLIHLKMSGQLIYVGDRDKLPGGHPTVGMLDRMPNSSTRVIFEFDDGSRLYFNDQRKFGWIRISNKLQTLNDKFLRDLSPEPLSPGFSWQLLKTNLLKHKNMVVKVALLDQKVVAGLGNIYVNEACFNARVDPRTKVNELTDKQYQKLHKGVIKALTDGISYGGSTLRYYVSEAGQPGGYQEHFLAYGQEGKPCSRCGTTIKKIRIGGRGTYFCQGCQR